jgi:Ca2+-binding EF-hand superfamily protein
MPQPPLPCPRWGGARALSLVLLVAVVGLAQEAKGQEMGDLERYQNRLQNLFRQLDSNGDGRLGPAEVKGRSFLETNFQRLDQGGKGYLVLEDLALPQAQRHFLGERLRQAFERADANHDGRLCGAEVAAFPWLQKHFAQADRNGDGCVTLEELWVLRRALAPRPQRDD